ncbi:MAG: ribosomal RNA small subunit methyltransferase A [Syntrophaceae bacterium]|nr:ribosomal RNA small subunit methyltransferase A [Syntrophaceae bacterium]
MSTTLKILRTHHIRPLKKYGQSFLIDDQIFRNIVAAGRLQANDTVVEIGAGLGVMTALLAEIAAKVVAVEVDTNLISVLRETLRGRDNVEIVNQDILSYDLSGMESSASGGKIKVMGNIPYNITSEILFHILNCRERIDSAVLLMQKEVAERFTADPGSKAYGIPTVILAMYADTEKLFDVSNQSFYPVPAVQSAVIRLTFRNTPRYPLQDEAFFRQLVRAAFAQRRKTLLNNLKAFRKIAKSSDQLNVLLNSLGIDGARRAETLTVGEFAVLSNAFFQKD